MRCTRDSIYNLTSRDRAGERTSASSKQDKQRMAFTSWKVKTVKERERGQQVANKMHEGWHSHPDKQKQYKRSAGSKQDK